MTDEQLCEALADQLAADHHQVAGLMGAAPTGSLRDFIAEAFKALRARGVTWSKIMALAGQIISIILAGGGNWTLILTQILALFFPPAPIGATP